MNNPLSFPMKSRPAVASSMRSPNKNAAKISLLLCFGLCLAPLASAIPSSIASDYTLILDEEFDYLDESGQPAIDPYIWTEENREGEPATKRGSLPDPTAINVVNDATGDYAVISAYTDPSDGEFYNGVLTSNEKYQSGFGYYDARIRWDNISSGTAAAFWLRPKSTPGTDAETGVEIDIIEMRAAKKGGYWVDGPGTQSQILDISDDFNFGVHWDGYNAKQNSIWAKEQPLGQNNSLIDGQFHVYGLEWTPTEYVVYFDDVEIVRVPRAAWDDPATTNINEGWLSKDKNGAYFIDYYHEDSGLTEPNYQVSYDPAISYAMEHIILSVEVRDPNFQPQDNWVGPLPADLGPLGAAANTTMTVDWVRVYEPSSASQSSFASPSIPGYLHAEDYDTGGKGVAYYDRVGSGVSGTEFGTDTTYRSGDTVDISTFSAGDYYVDHMDNREWLEYTVAPSTPGIYAVELDVANPTSLQNVYGNVLVAVDNQVLGSMRIDGSTDSGKDKVRRHAAPALAYLSNPSIVQVESISGNVVQFEGMQLTYLGNRVDCREAEDGAMSGSLAVTGGYVDGFTGTGTLTFDQVDGFDGGDAKLVIRYAGAFNANNTPDVMVSVNGNAVAVPFTFAEADFIKTTYQRSHYIMLTLDLPDSMVNPGETNTLVFSSDGSSNQDVRIDWVALTAEVDEPTGQPVITTYEAEEAAVSGGAEVSGSGEYVTKMNRFGAVCDWTVSSVAAGTATVEIHYANAGSTTTSKTLIVNGVNLGLVDFPVTSGNWSDFSDAPVTITVPVNAGSNSIILTRTGSGGDAGSVNFDKIVVEEPAAATTVTDYEAEAASVSGGAEVSGSGEFVTKMNRFGAVCDWSVTSGSAGTATVDIQYANAGSTTTSKTLIVNGVNLGLVDFPVTSGNWSDFSDPPVTITVPVNAGSNSIILTRTGSGGDGGSVNFDKITVTAP